MKKHLLFLSLMLVLSSCGSETSSSMSYSSISESKSEEVSSIEESSSILSSVEESEDSSAISVDSFIDENYEDSKDVRIIKSFFEDGEKVDRSINKASNVFKDATYSYEGVISDSYPDYNLNKLNDGITTELFDKVNWVCINDLTDDSVTFDVTNSYLYAGQINVHMLQIISYAIYYPTSVRLEASIDNSKFYKIGEIFTPTDISVNSDYTYTFAFDSYCSASYYRIVFTREGELTTRSHFFFVDEISAYNYNEDGEITFNIESDEIKDYYNYSLNTTSTTTKVSSSDSDYNTYQNLALLDGVSVDIRHFASLSKSEASENTSINDETLLHDGISNKNSSNFFKFAFGSGREITFDLGNIMAVDNVTIDALSKYNDYIQVFNAYSVEISVDGVDFVAVGGEFTNLLMNKTDKLYTFTSTFKECYKARYVRISFINDTNLDYLPNRVWISEISINGYKNAENKKEATYDSSIINGNYPNKDDFNVNNILFAPLRTNYKITEENALPYLAFLSNDGTIQDYFFDTVSLICNTVYTTDDLKERVKQQADFLLVDDENMGALDKVMEKINKTLGEDRKLKVSLTIDEYETSDYCSDCDNDGKNEDLSNAQDLADYLKYEVNYLINRFNQKQYKNLELVGFYFAKEYMNETTLDITIPAHKAANDLIHSKGLLSFWCPFNGVDTLGYWNQAGFDFCCYQPNYMFNEVNVDRLDSTALEAKVNGACVEIEIESVNNEKLNERYYKYLEYSIKYGHNHSIKMYYQGTIPGAYYNAYHNNYQLYEITYKYAKETLNEDFNAKSAVDLDAFTDLEIELKHDNTITFNLKDTSKVDINLITTPLYGNVKINLDGTITYNALYSYQGYDYIRLQLTDAFNNQKEILITLKITK